MIRLGKEELVRGLEGGVIGEMGVCRGCELGKPLAKPHPSKDVMYRATKKLELVQCGPGGTYETAVLGRCSLSFRSCR